MHEILEKLDDCVGRSSELFIVSATEEKETNCPIKPVYQEKSDETVYLSGKRKGSLRSRMIHEDQVGQQSYEKESSLEIF